MKKIIYISILSTLFLLGSCQKFLEVQPLAELDVKKFYKSKNDLDAGMAGMYQAFQSTMVGGGSIGNEQNDRYHYWGEFRSDNFDKWNLYTTDATTELALNGITPDNSFSNWSPLYNVISRANNNIKYSTGINDIAATTAVINSALAQSYAMRAICYFWIVRVWGDAPIWLEPYEDLSLNADRPRAPAAKILDEVIIADLKKAYSLTIKGATPSAYTIGEGAICAALADVYMWKKDYTNANIWFANLFAAKNPSGVAYAGASDANLEPTATWKSIFTSPATSKETIWTIHWDQITNGCACTTISFSTNNKRMVVDPILYTNYFLKEALTPTGDIRPKQTLDIYAAANLSVNNRDRYVKWYNSPVNPTAAPTAAALATYYISTAPVYLPMYRLSDMYLLYAESLNATGDLPGALKYLNYVRKRAGVAQYVADNAAVSTKPAMELTILQERQYELIGEGKRWFDIVRTGKVKEIMDPILISRQTAAGYSSPAGFSDLRKTLSPISRSVLNSNRALIQNPGYGD